MSRASEVEIVATGMTLSALFSFKIVIGSAYTYDLGITPVRSQAGGRLTTKKYCNARLFERNARLFFLTFFIFCYFLLLFLLLVTFISYFLLLKQG
jgi:hypothetical protein